MKLARLARWALFGPSCAVAIACASDAVDVPEPTLRTPGAFIGQRQPEGDVRLLRTVGGLTLENGQMLLLLTIYAPRVSSFDEARELAKGAEPPIEQAGAYATEAELAQTDVKVVWYRSLAPDERGGF